MFCFSGCSADSVGFVGGGECGGEVAEFGGWVGEAVGMSETWED